MFVISLASYRHVDDNPFEYLKLTHCLQRMEWGGASDIVLIDRFDGRSLLDAVSLSRPSVHSQGAFCERQIAFPSTPTVLDSLVFAQANLTRNLSWKAKSTTSVTPPLLSMLSPNVRYVCLTFV
jgi:hypothetical protein